MLLVASYHPQLHNLRNVIKKLFIYLHAEEQVKKWCLHQLGFCPSDQVAI